MSVSEWKAREKEQRRSDIVDAAEKLFFSKSYDEVSMDDIAKAIKLNKATLYRYFSSKEALFFTVVLRGVKIEHEMLQRSLTQEGNGLERLFKLGMVYYDFARQYPDYHRLVGYYASGRFDLCQMLRSEYEILVPSDKYEEWARTAGTIESKKIDDIMNVPGISTPIDKHCKWVKPAETTEGEVVREISGLRWEMFDATRSMIKVGQEDGSIRLGLSPGELAIFNGIIGNGLLNLSPDHRSLLDHMDIDRQQFVERSRAFLYNMLANKD